MACFVVPAAEAVVVAAAQYFVKKQEDAGVVQPSVLPVSRSLGWLKKLLGGGSALLAFEHLWHGELVPTFPFLTAAAEPAVMLQEMATVGVSMALAVTAAWGVLLLAAHKALQAPTLSAEQEGA